MRAVLSQPTPLRDYLLVEKLESGEPGVETLGMIGPESSMANGRQVDAREPRQLAVE